MKRCKHWLLQTTDRHAVGVTASASLLALQLAVHHSLRTLLVEYNPADAGTDALFAHQYRLIKHQAGLQSDKQASGWEALMRFARAGNIAREMVMASAIALYPNLDLLRVSSDDSGLSDCEESMEYNRVTQYITSLLTDSYDVIVWDMGYQRTCFVPMWLHKEGVGMIHVMSQNDQAWRLDMLEYQDERTIHVGVQIGLIPMHDQRLTLNVRNLRSKHRFMPLYAIPYDPFLRNSACEGSLLTYYLRMKHEAERGRSHTINSSLAEITQFIIAESGPILAASWEEEHRWG